MFKHLKRNKKSLKIMGVKRKPVSLTKFKRGCLIRMVLLLFSYCISNKVTERILELSCKTRFRRSSFSRIFRECVSSISPCSNKATKKIKVQICLPQEKLRLFCDILQAFRGVFRTLSTINLSNFSAFSLYLK